METVGFDTVRAGKGAADMSKGKDPLSARDWATADAYIAGHAEATPLQMLEPQSFFVAFVQALVAHQPRFRSGRLRGDCETRGCSLLFAHRTFQGLLMLRGHHVQCVTESRPGLSRSLRKVAVLADRP